jgi:alkylhydroperoxidase family enzyme
MVATLLRYPALWERLAALSAIVQCATAKLPVRERQLAIQQTVWLCGAPYQWGEHVERTKKAGVSAEEIERIKEGSAAPGWSADDRALLRAVEELHGDAFISDATWAELAKRFDSDQLFELIVLVGQFSSVAYLLNSMRMRLEPNNKGFGA